LPLNPDLRERNLIIPVILQSMMAFKASKSLFNPEFAFDVECGLDSEQKFIPSKYFYDKIGSKLFDDICNQPEYYPTRTETHILTKYSDEIAGLFCDGKTSMVELGSGSSIKTRILIDSFLRRYGRLCYLPIDVSSTALQAAIHSLSSDFSDLRIIGISCDYIAGMDIVNRIHLEKSFPLGDKRLVLFLGSSIGNFEPSAALLFLKNLRAKLDGSDSILIGFDLKKEPYLLNAAYNDKAGFTAKFNLNLLHRINRELGGEFDASKFSHLSYYDESKSRIEMHLVSGCDQSIKIKAGGRSFYFKNGETIHTENSYKYTYEMIHSLIHGAGYTLIKNFTDEKSWFNLALLSCCEMNICIINP